MRLCISEKKLVSIICTWRNKLHCIMAVQDLVGMAVVRHGSTAAIGKVVDIYDGTGVARLQFSQLG